MFQRVEQLRQNQSNPVEVFKQVTNGYNEEQEIVRKHFMKISEM